MHKLIRASAAVAILVIASVLTAAAPAPAQRAARSGHGFWLVVTPGESFTTAVRQATVAPGGGRVAPTLHVMLRSAEAGRAVEVPQGTRRGVMNVRASVSQLRAALSATRALSSHLAHPRAAGLSSRAVPLAWRVRGYACNTIEYEGQTWFATWCNLPLELDGAFCDPSCETVDRLEFSDSTDPATETSRVGYGIKNVVSAGYTSTFTDITVNYAATGTATCKSASSSSNQCLYPSLIGGRNR